VWRSGSVSVHVSALSTARNQTEMCRLGAAISCHASLDVEIMGQQAGGVTSNLEACYGLFACGHTMRSLGGVYTPVGLTLNHMTHALLPSGLSARAVHLR